MDTSRGLFTAPDTDWQERLDLVLGTVKELSSTEDPRRMVDVFNERISGLIPRDHTITLSRREVEPPRYRITRFTRWENPVDPWKHPNKVPVLQGGVLGDLIYGNEPRIINDFRVSPDDPAFEYLEGVQSLVAIPTYDRGEAMNMVVMLSEQPEGFNPEMLAEVVWTVNLFGRAVHNLRVGEALRHAYTLIDEEMKIVSGIQRSLLPQSIPPIPTLQIEASYETAQRAGGDYYDFFELRDGSWGILIADATGHGPAAAVLMAITHSIAHSHPNPPSSPGEMLTYFNRRLCGRYTFETRAFVTAFYGVYDPVTRKLTYANAGHEPPRIHRKLTGDLIILDNVGNLPLGVMATERYTEGTLELQPSDLVVMYTDGITEARSPQGKFFGTERLDALLRGNCTTAVCLLETILAEVDAFTGGANPGDDRTLLVADVG